MLGSRYWAVDIVDRKRFRGIVVAAVKEGGNSVSSEACERVGPVAAGGRDWWVRHKTPDLRYLVDGLGDLGYGIV